MRNLIPQSVMVETLLDGFDRIEEWNTDPFGHAVIDDFFYFNRIHTDLLTSDGTCIIMLAVSRS